MPLKNNFKFLLFSTLAAALCEVRAQTNENSTEEHTITQLSPIVLDFIYEKLPQPLDAKTLIENLSRCNLRNTPQPIMQNIWARLVELYKSGDQSATVFVTESLEYGSHAFPQDHKTLYEYARNGCINSQYLIVKRLSGEEGESDPNPSELVKLAEKDWEVAKEYIKEGREKGIYGFTCELAS